MNGLPKILTATAALLLMAGATESASAQEEVKIGISQPISGANGDYFKRELVNPVILAIEEINAKGGLLGRKVGYVLEDHKANAATAQSIARKLTEIDKVVLISSSISPAVLAALPVAAEHQVFIMTVSQHPKIAENPWGFRSSPLGAAYGLVQARFAANELKAKTAGLLGENNDAIRLQHAAFQKEFEAAGGKVVASESFNNGDQDYRAQLTKLRAANPDILNISATGPRAYGLALKQAAELNFKPKAVIATDTLIDPQLWEIAGNLASGIYYSVLDFDRAWNEGKFKPRFGYDGDAQAAMVYDGINIWFEAVRRAGTLEPAKVRETLLHLSDFKGVTGTWGYNGSGEPNLLPVIKRTTDAPR
jgi:branched-chain amino acid transport system substrate-binding protein